MLLRLLERANFKTGVTRKQSTPNFSKNEIFLPPDTHTCVCVSRGKKCLFSEICRALFPCNTSFEIRPFALLTTKFDLQSPDCPSFSYFISTIFFCPKWQINLNVATQAMSILLLLP